MARFRARRPQNKDVLLDFGPPRALGMVMAIVAVGLLLLTALACQMQYPEVAHLSLTLHTDGDFVWVRHATSGQIERTFASDKKFVQAGQPLLLLANNAAYEDIRKLEGILQNGPRHLPSANLPLHLRLGILQPWYLAYRQRALSPLHSSKNRLDNIERRYDRICDELAKWKSRFVISAPVSGQIIMTRYLGPTTVIEPEQPLMAIIVPASSIYATGSVDEPAVARLRPGQSVRLELKSYTQAQYGTIWGTIETVSTVRTSSGYLVRVNLPATLVTDMGFHPDFRFEMEARGTIIIEEVNLLKKIFNRFNALRSNAS
jgi:multidrug efflux pump subunit AcrA (membrane-fusion protein)